MPLENADIFKNSMCQATKYSVAATPQTYSRHQNPPLQNSKIVVRVLCMHVNRLEKVNIPHIDPSVRMLQCVCHWTVIFEILY
jgi:hypothetical protein